MNTSKGSERINDDGAAEINVGTVDYRKLPGQEELHPVKVAVAHLVHDDKPTAPANFLAGAAGKVAEKLQSAKEAAAETTSKME